MSPQNIRILIAGTLFLHGLAHGRAFIALVAKAAGLGSQPQVLVRSWLWPSLAPGASAALASPFWLLSTAGFVASSLSFWGIIVPGEAWRQLAVASAAISTLGIALFAGTWPGAPSRGFSNLDTAIAVFMNAVILVLLLWLKWPPEAMFGK
jgi:hypothetical protein